MNLNRRTLFSLSLLIAGGTDALTSASAWAWGPIGHRMIAETAAILCRDSTSSAWWGDLLARQRFELGYYAFVPDSVFRHQSDRLEAPTHYFDVDLVLGKKITEITDDAKTFSQLLEKAPADATRFPESLKKAGTAPWRVQQFYDLAISELKPVQKIKGGYQPGTSDPEGASKINQALFFMGVMAHYTGDSAMPYHATLDFNGWETGQGGIHFYFESDCVSAQEPGLSTDVLKVALQKKETWLKEWKATERSPFELDLRVLLDSATVVPEISQKDLKKVRLKPSQKETQTFATRKPPSQGCQTFKSLLTQQLAKASVLTAHLWERIYLSPEAKKIDVSQAKELQFSDLMSNPAYIHPANP